MTLTAALAACGAFAPAGAQTEGPGGASAAEVAVRFTVVDRENVLVMSLSPEDVSVTEGGKARAVTALRRADESPLALAVAVDVSVSQERVIGATKQAADAFLLGVMRPGVDEAGVVTFTGETKVEQELTGDVAKARAAVGRARVVLPKGYLGGGVVVGTPPGGSTPQGASAIWDTVASVAGGMLGRGPRPARRALLLISDGVDTASRTKPEEAARAAIRAGVVVYAVGIGDEGSPLYGVDRGDLRKLAERTGGRAFFPKKAAEIGAALAQIRADLAAPFVLTFAPADPRRDGSFRKLKIEIVTPALRQRGARVSHPYGYFHGDAPGK